VTNGADFERDPTDPSELKPVFDAIDSVRRSSEEHNRTIATALTDLRTLVLEHYHRTTSRLDQHARELRRIKQHVGISEPPPHDGL
jgi:hypothetical protein